MNKCAAIMFSLAIMLGPNAVHAQLGPNDPCIKNTEVLRNRNSSWDDLYRATKTLKKRCNDGNYAESMSDTIVKKIINDWPGFLEILKKHPNDRKFFNLVLQWINSTCDLEELRTVKRLASTPSAGSMKRKCRAIQKQASFAIRSAESVHRPAEPDPAVR